MSSEYDQEEFFAEYAKMARSREGLSASGEWHQLRPMFPSIQGKKVLDLGCGYGWHGRTGSRADTGNRSEPKDD